jgi:hypothetical protein
LRQVTLQISIIQQFSQQYYCECRLLYRLLLQVDVTDRCANSEFYSNLTYFWNKAHIFSIVVINRKFIQTGSYDRKNNHNSYLIYFRWMNSSFWYNMFIKRHLLKIYRCIYIHLKKKKYTFSCLLYQVIKDGKKREVISNSDISFPPVQCVF